MKVGIDLLALGVVAALLPSPARAEAPQRQPVEVDSAANSASVPAAVDDSFASPYALPANIVRGQAWARALAGYDGAAQAFRVSSSAEAALTGRLAFRADFDHGPSTSGNDRVSLGLRLQLLSQQAHGLDVGVGLFYQPEDFRGEGNILGGLMLGRSFGRVVLLGNALVGSDTEGDDQEIDGRLGALVAIGRRLDVGLDSRIRTALSSDAKRAGTSSVDWEMAVLPNANVRLGRVLLIGEAGLSALKMTELFATPGQRNSVRTGVIAMSGLAVNF
jgi:hypothetical protein